MPIFQRRQGSLLLSPAQFYKNTLFYRYGPGKRQRVEQHCTNAGQRVAASNGQGSESKQTLPRRLCLDGGETVDAPVFTRRDCDEPGFAVGLRTAGECMFLGKTIDAMRIPRGLLSVLPLRPLCLFGAPSVAPP